MVTAPPPPPLSAPSGAGASSLHQELLAPSASSSAGGAAAAAFLRSSPSAGYAFGSSISSNAALLPSSSSSSAAAAALLRSSAAGRRGLAVAAAAASPASAALVVALAAAGTILVSGSRTSPCCFSTSSSPSLTADGGAAATSRTPAFAIRGGVTSCEPPPPPSPLEFQVMAALEMKEELQKVRLAQVVNDLKKLAKTTTAAGAGSAAGGAATATSTGTGALLSSSNAGGGDNGGAPAVRRTGGIRRYVTMVVDSISKKEKQQKLRQQEQAQQNDGDEQSAAAEPHISMHWHSVSLEGVNLLQLTPDNCRRVVAALREGGRLNKKSIMGLVASARLVLQGEPTLIDLRENKRKKKKKKKEKITVVGDLHGSLSCLHSVLGLIGPLDGDEERVVIFDGDFVDRGEQSVEVLCTLLLLKLAYPNTVYLLRGNHEDHHVAAVYGFQDEVRLKYGSTTSEDLWDSLAGLFACLPIAAVTPTALVLHGGLPGDDFDLKQLERISPYDRRQVVTTMEDEASSPHQQLLTDILWSDPSELHTGIQDNPRGVGKSFGTDVASRFLAGHSLKYLVRGHEPRPGGFTSYKCGDVGEVLTVFSNAAYPGGQGTNRGAIVTLSPDGGYKTQSFSYDGVTDTSLQNYFRHQPQPHQMQAVAMIRSMIGANRSRLEAAFRRIQFHGHVTVEEWADILSEELELQSMPWEALQPALAPDVNDGLIDWRACLDRNSVFSFDKNNTSNGTKKGNGNGGGGEDSVVDSTQAEILHENHELLLTIFKYMDVDGNGQVDEEEFSRGVQILNKRLPPERQLQDASTIFKVLDHDQSGSMDFDEFARLFRFM